MAKGMIFRMNLEDISPEKDFILQAHFDVKNLQALG